MPGLSSMDDILYEITTNGKYKSSEFAKVSSNGGTSPAGQCWHEFFTATGVPAAGSWSGSAGVATQLTRSTTGALDIGANVSSDLRYLLSASILTTSSTITPGFAILCDFLLYYPACVVTGSPTSLDNTATLPRYTDGVGVMCFVAVQTALGATRPELTLTYTDDAGNTGNVAPDSMRAPQNSAVVSDLFHPFTINTLPWMPFLGADKGVRKIDSYTLASGTTGTVAFVLAKPLARIPLLSQYLVCETDFMYQMPSMPQVVDGACLGWLILAADPLTTNQLIIGNLTMAWG